MNERTLRPGNLAAAAVVIGGILVLALPQHAMSIIRLVIVTVAAGTGMYALAVNAPATWWVSPFDRNVRAGRKDEPTEIEWIRSTLSGRRQRIANGPPLPPETLRLLQPLIQTALERQGLDARDPTYADSVRRMLSARTWAVLTADPLKWPPRSRTLRPDKRSRTLPPDKRRTAEAVNAVLDELDNLGTGVVAAADAPSSSRPRPGGGSST